jgi:hypothetical protein
MRTDNETPLHFDCHCYALHSNCIHLVVCVVIPKNLLSSIPGLRQLYYAHGYPIVQRDRKKRNLLAAPLHATVVHGLLSIGCLVLSALHSIFELLTLPQSEARVAPLPQRPEAEREGYR